MHSNSGERTNSDPKSCMDWFRGKPHCDKEHYHGLRADLWPCDYQIPDAAFPAVIRGRAVLLHCSCQHHKIGDHFTEISIQTPQCYKYIALYPGPHSHCKMILVVGEPGNKASKYIMNMVVIGTHSMYSNEGLTVQFHRCFSTM